MLLKNYFEEGLKKTSLSFLTSQNWTVNFHFFKIIVLMQPASWKMR